MPLRSLKITIISVFITVKVLVLKYAATTVFFSAGMALHGDS